MTLRAEIIKLNQTMDELMKRMGDDGMPPVSIAFASHVIRPAFEMIIRAQHDKVPITDVDEAIVATLSAVLFDYFQRIHPKRERKVAVDHLKDIGQDVTERVMMQIDAHFIDLVLPPTRH